VPSEKKKLVMYLNNIRFSNGLPKPTDQDRTENIKVIGEKNVQKLLCYGHIKALPCLMADTIFHHVILQM